MLRQIRELLDRDPFQPFRIIMTGGDRFEVDDSHLVALGETQIVYCCLRSDRWADRRLNQIAAIDVLQAAA